MAYTEANLTTFYTDPTDVDAAIAWARLLSDDKYTDEIFSDVEWTQKLRADILTLAATDFYRPHKTVARWIQTDVTRGESESNRLGSITYREAKALADQILTQNAWMDDVIQDYLDDNSLAGNVSFSTADVLVLRT